MSGNLYPKAGLQGYLKFERLNINSKELETPNPFNFKVSLLQTLLRGGYKHHCQQALYYTRRFDSLKINCIYACLRDLSSIISRMDKSCDQDYLWDLSRCLIGEA